MRRTRASRLLALPAVVLAIGAMGTSVAMAQASKSAGAGAYIVQLSALPVASNPGTAAAAGDKIDPNSAAVQSYMASLAAQQNALMARAGVTKKLYNYGYTFNGFAAEMSAEQAAALEKMPGVVSVTKDELMRLDTATTPGFIGLSGPGGFYATTGAKGENIIIGIVDSGIWPGHPSFAGAGFGAPPAKWKGTCQTGPGFTAADCNNKLLGARFYNAGFGGNPGITATFPYEYNSPKDAGGHGTHTASTSGGNEGVSTAGSVAAAFGMINGIAPRARVAAYKVCWGDSPRSGTLAGCATSDSMAAIDQAVADGVDVINFSISGTQTNFVHPVETAFRNAAAANVFVAASAGNSGPTFATVAHPSPWITTVAAATHNRSVKGTVTLGSGASFTGASTSTTAVAAGTPMIASAAAGLAGAPASKVAQCHAAIDNGGVAVLDPAKVAGKIVVCDRGVTARVNKSLAVKDAGGVGMVLANVSPSSLDEDFHSVPTVHVNHTDGPLIRTYAGTPGATAAISTGVIDLATPAPFIASFSSRGPTPNFQPVSDLLKPDISAPGQNILAGHSPDGNSQGSLFAVLSGTSMSSPHIAGVGALMKQVFPTWSPMAIKSALMTTSKDVLDAGGRDSFAGTVAHGAGFVDPKKALNPGLVYDSGPQDWNAFLCGVGMSTSFACPLTSIDPSDLNLASIAIFDLPMSQTVKRRVTNVSGAPQTFTASTGGLPGFTVVVSPASLSLAPGQTREFTVNITRTTAAAGSFYSGSLTWSNGMTTVRSPILVAYLGSAGVAPPQIIGTGGLMQIKLKVGTSGPFSAMVQGLVAPQLNTGTASTGSSATFPVVVPPGTTHARFSMFDADVKPGSDIDIIVRDPLGAIVGTGFSGTSQEEVNLVAPAPGTYTVEVTGFSVAGTSPFKLHSWVVPSTSAGNLFAYGAPPFVTAGQEVRISLVPLTYALTYGVRYLGRVAYGGVGAGITPTLVQVNR